MMYMPAVTSAETARRATPVEKHGLAVGVDQRHRRSWAPVHDNRPTAPASWAPSELTGVDTGDGCSKQFDRAAWPDPEPWQRRPSSPVGWQVGLKIWRCSSVRHAVGVQNNVHRGAVEERRVLNRQDAVTPAVAVPARRLVTVGDLAFHRPHTRTSSLTPGPATRPRPRGENANAIAAGFAVRHLQRSGAHRRRFSPKMAQQPLLRRRSSVSPSG